MPYTLQRTRRGCQVIGPRGKRFSRRPIACRRAAAQARLLRAIEHGWKPSRNRKTRKQRGGSNTENFPCGFCSKCGHPGQQMATSPMGDRIICACANRHTWTV